MRKFIKSLALVAVAAMTLSACQKEVELQKKNADGLYEYSFAILEDGTKAVIGDSNIEWVTGDQVGMFVGSYKGYAKVDVTQTPRMVVLYSNQVIPAGTMAYAYSPFDGSNTDATNAKITLSEIQSGAAISAMPLAGIPFEVKEEVEAGNQEGNGAIKFLNLGSLINFKIYSSNVALQSETITSVKFEATKRLAGTGTLDLTAVNMNDEGTLELDFEGDDEIHFVKVDGQSVAVAASKDDATPIKMVVLPGSFEGTLTITTDAATYTKVMPEREYVRSGLRTWGLDLTKAERVEGVEEVVKTLPYDEPFSTNKGDFSIENIVMPEGLTAVWTHGSHNTDSYMQATAYVNGTRYETESMLVSPWIDLSDAVAAEFTFDNAYSYTSSPATDFSVLVKTDLEGSEWVSISNINYGTGSFNWAKNVSVSLNDYLGNKVKVAFKYTSTSSTAGTWEIKNFSAHIVKADPQISYERETWDVELGDETAVGQELTNPNNLVVTYSSSNTDVVLVDEETGDIVVGDVAGFAIITATFAGNDTYNAGTASYRINVNDPNSSNVTDVLDYELIGVTGTGYSNWSGITSESDAEYSGNTAGGNEAIQFRSNNNNSGIVTTVSGGSVKKVSVIWNSNTQSGRVLNIYGKNSAYNAASDLYSNYSGALLGTIVYGTTTELEIEGNYSYLGIRSDNGAIWLDEIDIEWSTDTAPVVEYNINISESSNGSVTANPTSAEEGSSVVLTITPDSGYELESLTIDDEDWTEFVADNSCQFTMPNHDVTVSASFSAISAGTTTYTITWNATNNSASVNSYTNSWEVTSDGLTCTMENWNNNQNNWSYVRTGSKNSAMVANITSPKIAATIKTVKLTIDSVTSSNVNSIKLYVSSSSDFNNASSYSFTVGTGEQSVAISSPSNDCYYKIEVDCKKGGSNGFVQVSKLVFTTL